MPSTTIWHAADCPEPITSRVIGRLGDTLERCRNCRRFTVIRDQIADSEVIREPVGEVREDHAPEEVATELPGGRSLTRWVCGNHIDRTVTWRGTGCPDCKADHDARQERRHLTERITRAGLSESVGRSQPGPALEVHLPPSYPFPFGTADHE